MDLSWEVRRLQALEARSWGSSGSTFNARLLRAGNLALAEIASAHPEEVIPEWVRQYVFTQIDGDDATIVAKLEATADKKVLRFVPATGSAPLGTGSGSSLWLPTVTGVWDGVMWLEVQEPVSLRWIRMQSFEWWTVPGNGAANDEYYVSIDKPWRNTTDLAMAFRISQPELIFPGDIDGPHVRGRIFDDSRYHVKCISDSDARVRDLRDHRGQDRGPPAVVWPDRESRMQPPYHAPTITYGLDSTWLGPVQEGDFRFFYTWAWGRRSKPWGEAHSLISDPVWESPPSPISAVATHAGANAGLSIILQASNIDAMMGFDVLGALSEGRSGRRIRFYVMRDAIYTGGAGTYNEVETAGIPYLLDEVEPATGSPTARYTWTGAVLPDYSRRYRRSSSHRAWLMFPQPDSDYEIDFEVYRKPREIVSDRDVVPVREEIGIVFHYLLLSHMCMIDGSDMKSSDHYRVLAWTTLQRIRSAKPVGSGVISGRAYGGSGRGRTGRSTYVEP
jgi:hypothetical protein